MKDNTSNIVRIGTSNIVVPGTKQTFPAGLKDRSRLYYYSSLFNSLELNSSFYKVPMQSTFKKWCADVPDNFQFTVKLWREVTHAKKLDAPLSNIDYFMKAANQVELQKRGCILIQFPGKITLGCYNKVQKILERLVQNDAENTWRKAVEFRSPTWYTGETFELLDEYSASMVLHDITKSKNVEVNKKAKFVYMRFHGPTGTYRGSYPDDFLKEKARQINNWVSENKEVYAYFNNTMGNAFENAMALQQLIK